MAEDQPAASTSQDDIDAILKDAEKAAADAASLADVAATAAAPTDAAAQAEAPTADAAAAPDADGAGDLSGIDAAAIDDILKQASFEDPQQAMGVSSAPATEEVKLPNFQQVMQDAQVSSIDLLRDVDLQVKIELGRARMLVEDVLKLGEGSVVELEKLAGDPVDVFVNERLVARGEVLVLNDSFCVRINEIVAGAKEEGM